MGEARKGPRAVDATAKGMDLKIILVGFAVTRRVAVVSFRSKRVLTHRDSSDLEFGDLGTLLALLVKHVAPPIARIRTSRLDTFDENLFQ